jgi:hypothetical protein
MKPDEFENQLRRQAVRPVPTMWRDEILVAAKAAAVLDSHAAPAVSTPWWREWLWPSPQAWAGLAAAWIVIAVLNATTEPRPVDMAKQVPLPSADTEATLAAQRRELARLLDNPIEPAPPPKTGPPGPRSENFSPPKV